MARDPKRKRNLALLIGLFIFALALGATVIILMLLRGPATTY